MSESGNDTLEFGSGITSAGIKTHVYGNDLSVEYGNNEGVWIYDGYKGAIENFRFANGITLDWHRLLGISLKTNLVFKTSEMGRVGKNSIAWPSSLEMRRTRVNRKKSAAQQNPHVAMAWQGHELHYMRQMKFIGRGLTGALHSPSSGVGLVMASRRTSASR